MTQKTKKNKGDTKRTKSFFVALITVLSLAVLAWVLLLPPNTPDKNAEDKQKQSSAQTADTSEVPLSEKQSEKHIFEEKLAPDFDQKVRQVDLVLMQALAEEPDKTELKHSKLQTKHFHGIPFHFQTLEIQFVKSPDSFLKTLKKELTNFVNNSSIESNPKNKTWTISINGQETHVIHLIPDDARTKPDKKTPQAKLAIIIDDMGRSKTFARELAKLDIPITFSILPHSPYCKKVREIAIKSGLTIMLHLPMQPESWPETDPGPGALFADMTAQEIQKTIQDDLEHVPEAIGANNHMGSKFTASKKGMDEVFKKLRTKRMFFLDSLTTPESVAEKCAEENLVSLLKRNIFLDNIQDKKAIVFQLKKAEKIAQNSGSAIAIGHPYPETLEALRAWSNANDTKVSIVSIEDLL